MAGILSRINPESMLFPDTDKPLDIISINAGHKIPGYTLDFMKVKVKGADRVGVGF